jgi:threonylcarbamoyladenosine tRNA methylthiotransferase MtaB
MKVYLTSIGCRLNEAEVATWAREFQLAGHAVTTTPADADAFIFNSCAVTTEAARKSRQFVKRLHRLNPNARLVVTGCYASLEPEKVAGLMGVDLVVSNADKDKLVAQVAEAMDWSAMPNMATEPGAVYVYPGSRTRAFVKVQDGCRNRCTFCIVTVARGEERSRSIAAIVEEIRALYAAGYQEVVLTGVHLGGYGADLDEDLFSLVQTILADTDIPRLRLSSLEPWDLPPRFFELWQNPRVMPHLHLPLQSGSDRILRRMARRYTTEAYARLIADARATIPDFNLTTDIIVGFPGESESDWAQTVDFVQAIGFGHMHIFTYSIREGTAAARMPLQVPGDIKRARSRELHGIAARMKAETLARYAGSVQQVLWEGPGEVLSSGDIRWTGYTGNYLRVETVTSSDIDLENRILPVQLTGLMGDPPDRLQGLVLEADAVAASSVQAI